MKGFDDTPRDENPNAPTFTDQMRRKAHNQTAEALRDSLLTWLSEGIASQDISRAFGGAVSEAVHKTAAGEMQGQRTQAAISEAVAKGVRAALEEAVSVENIAKGVLKSLEPSWQAAVRQAVEREVAVFFNRSQVQNEVMSIVAKEVGNTISDVMDSRRGIVEKAVRDAAMSALSDMDISSPLVAVARATIRSNMDRAATEAQSGAAVNNRGEFAGARESTKPVKQSPAAPRRTQAPLRKIVPDEDMNSAWDYSMPWLIRRSWPDFADFETEYRPFQNVPASGLKPLKRFFLISALSAAARGLKGDLAEDSSFLDTERKTALKNWRAGEWHQYYKSHMEVMLQTLSGFIKIYPETASLKTASLGPKDAKKIRTQHALSALREIIEKRALLFNEGPKNTDRNGSPPPYPGIDSLTEETPAGPDGRKSGQAHDRQGA